VKVSRRRDIKSKQNYLTAGCHRLPPLSSAHPWWRFSKTSPRKNSLCVYARDVEVFTLANAYMQIYAIFLAWKQRGQFKKARRLKLSHVWDCTIMKSLPYLHQGETRCLTMRTVKRWCTHRWPLIFAQRDDVTSTDCVYNKSIDVTHDNSDPASHSRKHSIFKQIYRLLILCQCPK